MFYEITLFDGEESIDVHVIKHANKVSVRMPGGGPLTSRARNWLKRGFWRDDEAPEWVVEKLSSKR